MRKLERSLWEMKMEPLWPDDTRGGSNFRSELGREIRHNLERELATDFRRGWDGDWGREFEGSLTSQRRTDPLSTTGGGSSSASTAAPVFAYSQKNFHIADGNLYSIFSPFQARKSTSRPSFLRGQSEQSSPTPPASGSASPRSSSSSTRNRRWKLKFHHQDIPAQYRTPSATAGSSAAAGTSTGEPTDSAGPSTSESSHSRMSSSSSFFSSSRTSYSSSSFKEFSETCRESSSFRHSFDDEDLGLSSLRRGIKREDPFEVLDLSQPRLGLFSDWPRNSGAGGGTSSAKHDEKTAEFGSLHRRLRKSHFRSSVFDDSDDEEQSNAFRAGVNEPLNLCLADHAKRRQERQQRKEESGEERVHVLVKDEPVDVDSEEPRPSRNVSPFTAAKERFEQRRRHLFGERRSMTDSTLASMLSRTPSPPPPPSTKKESGRRRTEEVEVLINLPKEAPREGGVLDLSLRRKQEKMKRKVHFEKQGGREDTWSRSTPSSSAGVQLSPAPKEEETSSSPLWRGRRVPYISQMLENMSIWDEDTNSPRPIDLPPCIETEDDSMESVQQIHTTNRQRLQHPPYTHQQYHAFTPAYLSESILPGFGSKFAKTESGSFLTDHMAREYEMMRKAFEAKAAAFFDTSSSTAGTSLEVPIPTMKSNTAPNLAVTPPQPSPSVQRSESEPTVGGSYCVFLPGTFVHPGPVYVTPQQQPIAPPQDNVPSKVVTTIHVTAPSPPPAKEQGTNVTTVELKPKVVDSKLNLLTLPNLSSNVAPKPFPRQKRHAVDIDTSSATTSSSPFANDISICKFKLIKGVQPMLEEKKTFYVPLPRSSVRTEPPKESASSVSTPNAPSTAPKQERFRTYKIHVGSQEELGRKLAAGKKLRRRSRKALVREKLEATFREQGFLIKTQQVSSAEGSVYCKFRQLKKFTRYLFKSWRNYLPKDLEEISGPAQAAELFGSGSLPPPGLLSFAESPAIEASGNAQLCSPGTSRTSSVSGSAFGAEPYVSVCSPGTSRSPSLSGTSGIGTSIFTGDSASVASPASDGASSAALLDTISLSGSSLLSPASSASSASSTSPASMAGSDAR